MGNSAKMTGNMTPEHREVMDDLVALTRMQLKKPVFFHEKGKIFMGGRQK